MSEKQDAKNILEGIKNQDTKIISQVYKSYLPLIKAFVLNNNGNIDDAKDIFQDALVAIYEKVKVENLVIKCKFSTYLYSIARNLWLNRLRRKYKTVSLQDNNEYLDELIIESEELGKTEYEEKEAFVNELLNQVSPKCRQILYLYYYKNYDMKSIARELNYKNSNVAKKKKYQCLQGLIKLVNSKI